MTNMFDSAQGATMTGADFMERDPQTQMPPQDDRASDAASVPSVATRPDYLPEKFWDDANAAPNVEALARSYAELERRFGDGDWRPPEAPDGYSLNLAMDGLEIDPAVNERLHAAGFNQAQAQLVYDLAAEKLGPLAQAMAQSHIDGQLAQRYGTVERATQARAQMEAWAESALPPGAAEALSATPQGLQALETLMRASEPDLIGRGAYPLGPKTHADLQNMMNDPRYWRDHEPSYVAEVQRGFELLYPGDS